ncbi:outer membrane beta-barrel protein [Curvibacter sp. CHRR-16]|uniref:outer membrane beta-barrel protein n=1 Tax=Curvibacter sp. CHRR-16 TaxID=2835872 RepID=UPI001BDB3689|nr:outer membrane beta-barrel protein [Curvibacter sp. CHRR-16]MBT0569839.1 outer membrane beta-barrel protein [Curvibacter sp. CHRR-16]
MKRIAIVAAAASFAFAGQAFAQAQNFAGFQVGASVDLVSGKNTGSSGQTDSTSQSTANLGLTAQYNWALGESWVLGAGASIQAVDNKFGEWTNETAKLKNAYSAFAVVGYAKGTNLYYGKLASVGGSGELSGIVNQSKTVSGTGLGFGLQSNINKNVLWNAELMFSQYDKQTYPNATGQLQPTSSTVSFGIAYKF